MSVLLRTLLEYRWPKLFSTYIMLSTAALPNGCLPAVVSSLMAISGTTAYIEK
jgi:hypothetical protein